ncbi:hypothetical protein QBC47DRAFT_418485 [Echria macrotheca]|uniref:FAD dependent oxidoreductase domain-containing protein n=1 Tax=Echria macrotheca TaxID=438768 RepID=A0AAJ0F681_9PEZI|nr:hypothetical protein QBC47DRAFT_418485 [Echria macrotheca]
MIPQCWTLVISSFSWVCTTIANNRNQNGGHCQPVVFTGTPESAAFELANFHFLESLVRSHNIPCDWTPVAGGVRTFLTPSLFAEAAASAVRFQKHFPDHLEIVYPENSERLAELRIPNVAGAIVQRCAASLWPYKLVAYLLEELVASHGDGGFNLQTNTPATKISRKEDGRWEVVTPRGSIMTRQVLLATNGHTGFLLPEMADLVVPVRGQVAALVADEPPEKLGRSYGFDGEPSADQPWRSDYLIQRPTGKNEFIFGGGRGLEANMGVGEWRDNVIEDKVSHFLKTQLAPPLDLGQDTKLEAAAEWTGIMGYSRDMFPFVGQVPSSVGGGEGLFLCAGFTGHGMPNAALSAHAVVGMMGGRPEKVDYRLPGEYVLDEERVVMARGLVTVEEWEGLGWAVDFPGLFAR